jgi:hypothetical protein
MGHVNLVVSKKNASAYIVVCMTLAVIGLIGIVVALMVKIKLIYFYLNSSQLDNLQNMVAQVCLFGFIVSFVSMYMIDAPLKSRIYCRISFDKLKPIVFLYLALAAFLTFSASAYFSPPKTVHYILSENRWHLYSKSSQIIEIFEDSLGRAHAWNSILQMSILLVGLQNISVWHLLNIIKRIDCRTYDTT